MEITLSLSTIIGGEDEVTQVQTGVLLGARVGVSGGYARGLAFGWPVGCFVVAP